MWMSRPVPPSELDIHNNKLMLNAHWETDSHKLERHVMLQYIEAINKETSVADDNNPVH